MSLFDEISKTESEGWETNGFNSISYALITAFVFISTAENYSMIYNIFDSDYYSKSPYSLLLINALSFLLICGLLGLFCFIPMIIHRFEEAFSECEMKQKRRDHYRKTNCIIASFIMLDMNNDMTIDKQELKQLISKSVLINKKVFDIFKKDDDDSIDNGDENDGINFNPDDDDAYGVEGIDLQTFVNYLLTQTFRSKLLANCVPFQSRLQAFLECNIFRRSEYNTLIFVILIVPAFVISILKGISGINNDTIDGVLLLFFIGSFIEINLRWFTFGFRRFWDLLKYPSPNYIISTTNKYYASQKLAQISDQFGGLNEVIRLTSNERRWATSYLKATRPLSTHELAVLTLMHRIELSSIYITFTLYVISRSLTKTWKKENATQGYENYFLQVGILLRTFTLLKANQKLTYSVFTVFPQFVALLIFLGLYIISWARLGCALFGNKTAIVIEDVYEAAPGIVANFNNTGYSILCLIQLMVGEGWHEIMYLNAIATSFIATIYFIIYITVVTIIISNVFVGLFLAGIDDLEMEQSEMKALEKCMKSNKSFKKYAVGKLKMLKYRLSSHKDEIRKTKQQIKHLSFLLKQHQKHTIYNESTSKI
eukprot:412414_1